MKGLNLKAEKAGELSSKIDAKFQVTDLDSYESTKDLTAGSLGLTEAAVTDQGKLSVTYHMHSERSDFFQEYGLKTETGAKELLHSVDTWSHETLIHGYAKEQNFFGGNYKGMTGKIPFDGGREHGANFVRKTPYYQNTYNMLKAINRSLKLGVSEDHIWKKIMFHGY